MYICFVTNSGFGALTYKSMHLTVVESKFFFILSNSSVEVTESYFLSDGGFLLNVKRKDFGENFFWLTLININKFKIILKN